MLTLEETVRRILHRRKSGGVRLYCKDGVYALKGKSRAFVHEGSREEIPVLQMLEKFPACLEGFSRPKRRAAH